MNLLDQDRFQGVPVFPLPEYVLFPHTLVPFHIFEPRYRQMIEECLAGERLIVVSGLLQGWEDDYYGAPPICRVGCLGKIVNEERVEDGRYNIFVNGLAPVAIGTHRQTQPYRIANVDVLQEATPQEPDAVADSLSRLRQVCAQLAEAAETSGEEALHKLLATTDNLDVLTYRLSAMAVADPKTRQILLEAGCPLVRAELLVRHVGHTLLRLSGPSESSPGMDPSQLN